MAASAGRSLPLLLCRRRGAAATISAAGCFPALGRRRQQQQRHRTVMEGLQWKYILLEANRAGAAPCTQEVLDGWWQLMKQLHMSGFQFDNHVLELQECNVEVTPLPFKLGSFKVLLNHVAPTMGGESKVHQRLSPWQSVRVVYCSTVVPSDEVTVVYQNGLPVISVNLPSRRERCQFTLKPISDSVGVFLQQLQAEDRGIDRVAIYSADGTRVASSTGIDLLLLDDFKLIINDITYHVRPPKRELLSHENATTLNDVKTLVQQLYTALCIEEHQLNKEKELIGRLEELKEQLAPLEKVRLELSRKAEKRTTLVLWGGLAYMATQFGILARLTWWEYSWDIMEPVTYFITYGSAMAMYAYFVMTRQEYVYPDARDRQYLLFFHKGAKKSRFDLEKYNQLKDAIAQAELDLKRLRDPLQVHLPIQQIDEKD